MLALSRSGFGGESAAIPGEMIIIPFVTEALFGHLIVRLVQGEDFTVQQRLLPLFAAHSAAMALLPFLVGSWPEGGFDRGASMDARLTA